MVFPEQVTDAAIAKILDALKHIDSELNDYISDRDTARLANVLDTGLQNLILAVRNCIGRWQLGKGPWRIQRLDLRLGIPDIAGRPAAYPVLKILIDGTEVLAGRRCQYTGWHPADILGPDSPLLPAEPARRVALYVDAAGGATAGCLAAYVKAFGDHVAWADFRRFDGVYHAPAVQPDPDGGDWQISIPPPVFDAAQYLAEVRRASTERAWEAGPWRLPHPAPGPISRLPPEPRPPRSPDPAAHRGAGAQRRAEAAPPRSQTTRQSRTHQPATAPHPVAGSRHRR